MPFKLSWVPTEVSATEVFKRHAFKDQRCCALYRCELLLGIQKTLDVELAQHQRLTRVVKTENAQMLVSLNILVLHMVAISKLRLQFCQSSDSTG